MQSLLRKHGSQSILQRIRNHDISTIDKRCLQRATELLNTSSAEEVRSLSVGAAAFYNWVCDICIVTSPTAGAKIPFQIVQLELLVSQIISLVFAYLEFTRILLVSWPRRLENVLAVTRTSSFSLLKSF